MPPHYTVGPFADHKLYRRSTVQFHLPLGLRRRCVVDVSDINLITRRTESYFFLILVVFCPDWDRRLSVRINKLTHSQVFVRSLFPIKLFIWPDGIVNKRHSSLRFIAVAPCPVLHVGEYKWSLRMSIRQRRRWILLAFGSEVPATPMEREVWWKFDIRVLRWRKEGRRWRGWVHFKIHNKQRATQTQEELFTCLLEWLCFWIKDALGRMASVVLRRADCSWRG